MVQRPGLKRVDTRAGTAEHRNPPYFTVLSLKWAQGPSSLSGGSNPDRSRCVLSNTSKNFCRTSAARAASSMESSPSATAAAMADNAGAMSSGPLIAGNSSRMTVRPFRAGAIRFRIHCAAATFAYCAALRIVLNASGAASSNKRSTSAFTRLRAPRGLPLLPTVNLPSASRPEGAEGPSGGGSGGGGRGGGGRGFNISLVVIFGSLPYSHRDAVHEAHLDKVPRLVLTRAAPNVPFPHAP
jgi:hypothetical protein